LSLLQAHLFPGKNCFKLPARCPLTCTFCRSWDMLQDVNSATKLAAAGIDDDQFRSPAAQAGALFERQRKGLF
jgi:hypothetical protein